MWMVLDCSTWSDFLATFIPTRSSLAADQVQLYPCGECNRNVRSNQYAILWSEGDRLFHAKCIGMRKHIFKNYLEQHHLDWQCSFCSLPRQRDLFFEDDLQAAGNDGSFHEEVSWDEQINNGHGSPMCILDFEKIAKEYMKNCKTGHINANSIAGHKFYEIRHWLRSGFFDTWS